jgi:hypothetical protein
MTVDLSREAPAPTLFLAPEVERPAEYPAPYYPDTDPSAVEAAVTPSRLRQVAAAGRAVRWSAVALAVVLIAVEVVIAAESFGGLVEFAHLIGIHGKAAYGVPVTLDGVGLVAALMALRAELSGESSAMPRLALFAFTGASAAANWWAHRADSASALYYGGMSLAVALMFALVLRQLRAEDRRRAGLVSDRLPKFAAPLWLRYPRLTWRAWSLAVLRGYRTPREAVDAALAAALPAICLDREALAALPPRDRLVVAFGSVGSIDVPKALALLERHGVPVDQSHAYQIRKSLTATGNAS